MKKLNIFLSSLFLTNLAFSQETFPLLESMTRPRILEFMNAYPRYTPEENIPYSYNHLNFSGFAKSIEVGGPQFIATLQAAHPNAIFAFLGRDTQLIADIVEAFYLSIGQKDRVSQVGMSKPTLANLNDAQIIKYLENFGFSLDRAEKGQQKPFILVDTVSKGEVVGDILVSGRQGRQLLQIVYTEWVRRGHPVESLLPIFNMMAMQVSTFKYDQKDNMARYAPATEMDTIQARNIEILKAQKAGQGLYGINMVLPIIKDTRNLFNEAGYDHYTGAWHDRYQEPIFTSDGRITPNPGEKTADVIRKSILWIQNEVVKIVNKTTFRQQVQAEAQKRGFSFLLKEDSKLVACKHAYKLK